MTQDAYRAHYITPGFRTFVRAEMSSAVIKPTAPEYADCAEILTKLVPAVVAGISDADLDRMILSTLDPYILRRNQL